MDRDEEMSFSQKEWIAYEEGFVECAKHLENLVKLIRKAHQEDIVYRKKDWKEYLRKYTKGSKKK